MRRRARVDDNHAEIVAALRAVGCDVMDLSRVGEGCPDLFVAHPRMKPVCFVEVKDGRKPPSARRLTPAQEERFDALERHGAKVVMVLSVDDALQKLGFTF